MAQVMTFTATDEGYRQMKNLATAHGMTIRDLMAFAMGMAKIALEASMEGNKLVVTDGNCELRAIICIPPRISDCNPDA